VSVSAVLYPRWPPLLKIEISSNGQKLLYFKPESAQIMRDTILEEDQPRFISAKVG
jgi:hypothetical protein